ncbi:unnamed protein product, partial [marine sediment metagenome]
IKATLLQGALHWDYITNEPTYYPPEYHYHVGKEIVSLHLVDLDYDPEIHPEDADIFDILPTAAIHSEGNYDWWGTWVTDADADTSAEIVVLAGDYKMLRLTDNNVAGFVATGLSTDAGHPIVTGVIEFQIRMSAGNKRAYITLLCGANNNIQIFVGIVPQTIRLMTNGEVADLGAWAAGNWCKIRLHFDCVARSVVAFLDNVWAGQGDLAVGAAGNYVDKVRFRT